MTRMHQPREGLAIWHLQVHKRGEMLTPHYGRVIPGDRGLIGGPEPNFQRSWMAGQAVRVWLAVRDLAPWDQAFNAGLWFTNTRVRQRGRRSNQIEGFFHPAMRGEEEIVGIPKADNSSGVITLAAPIFQTTQVESHMGVIKHPEVRSYRDQGSVNCNSGVVVWRRH